MGDLVKVVHNDIFTDSLVIAEGTGNKHESVQRRIRDYEKELLTLGKVGFEIRAMVSGQEQKIYQLNEPQATFLITLLKNTDVVVKFKLELVKQFYAMRQLLFERQSPHWQHTRLESKSNRKMETDEIKQFVSYAKGNGSKSSDKYYISLSKLANKAVGLESNQRDMATTSQLNNLILIEHIIGGVIVEGIQQDLYYKDIYKACKARIEQFKQVAYLQKTA